MPKITDNMIFKKEPDPSTTINYDKHFEGLRKKLKICKEKGHIKSSIAYTGEGRAYITCERCGQSYKRKQTRSEYSKTREILDTPLKVRKGLLQLVS